MKSKKAIKQWLDKYRIRNYMINDDCTIDVNGDVDLVNQKLACIPVQFGTVTGEFNCSSNSLLSLEGCPYEVQDNFECNHNNLISLEHAPKKVIGSIYALYNEINQLDEFSGIFSQKLIIFGRVKIPGFESFYNDAQRLIVTYEQLTTVKFKNKLGEELKLSTSNIKGPKI